MIDRLFEALTVFLLPREPVTAALGGWLVVMICLRPLFVD